MQKILLSIIIKAKRFNFGNKIFSKIKKVKKYFVQCTLL